VKLHISHGADPDDWFVVKPLEGQTSMSIVNTPITHEMELQALRSAGRPVYELDVPWLCPDGGVCNEAGVPRADEDMCEATYGPEGAVQAWCTEAKNHDGPWHIASTGAEIVKVWPVHGLDVPEEAL
jgi:hypothetical protein